MAIVDALLDEIYNLHTELEYIRKQAYITTSDSEYTDLVADLVDIKRNDFESDENLKIRAQNSVHKHAKGNIVAIEETAKQVSGVAGIRYRPYGYGTGSFIIYIYPEAHENQLRLIERVREALDEVVSEGIYYEVKAPTEIPIDIEVILNLSEDKTISERNIIRSKIERKIRGYLNGFEMNDIVYINEVISQIMSVDEAVLDANIIEYKVDGIKRPLSNTYPANEEKFISGKININ